MDFLNWYYTKGIRGFFSLWSNFFFFWWKFFSVRRLFATLFSHWKRDVVFRDWRGFRPLRSLQTFLVNEMFRLVGAVVRTTVICFAIFMEVLTLVLGLAILFLWTLFPLVVIAAFVGTFMGKPILIFVLVTFLVFFVVVFKSYMESKEIPYSEMSLRQLAREDWFVRVADRTGISPGELADEADKGEEKLEDLLKRHELTTEEFNDVLRVEMDFQQRRERKMRFWSKEFLLSIPSIGRQWTYGYTVNLDEYAMDISRHDPTEYGEIDLIGFKEELEMILIALGRKNQNSVLLTGDAGIGKKSVVHFLARSVRQGRAKGALGDARFMLLDLSQAVSSAQDRGANPEHVLHALFSEAAYAGNVVLVIENISKYFGTAKGSAVNIAAVIDEYLKLPSFRMLATSTKGEYHRIIERHDNVMKNFRVIEVKESSEKETLHILLQKFRKEEQGNIIFSFHALRDIIKKSDRLGRITPLPERAIDLAYETLLYWKKNPQGIIDPGVVNDVISLKTGVNHGKVEEEEKKKLLNLEEILHRRVIGQDRAINQIADVVRKMRAGIGNEKKPVGSFLFLGPTGVGKTETAKALAEAHFGNEEKMIRFDMSEFQTSEAVDRLIGSQVTGEPGFLTSKIKDSPFSLVLLDELEKACPEILDLFLQVLDEGMITDAFGEKVSFRGAIIIATSNAGASLIKDLVEQKKAASEIGKKLVDHIVSEGVFRVEFLNRFDGVISFGVLDEKQLREVVALMLKKFELRLEEEKNIIVEFDPKVVEKIIRNGYDPVFGARSVARYIADSVEDVIAKKIIAGEIEKGQKLRIGEADVA